MSQILKVVTAFGPFVVDQIISDPTQVALILEGPNVGDVVDASAPPGSAGSALFASPFATHGEVLGDIQDAFAARGVPAGSTVPGLISTALAAQGLGSAASPAQVATLALILG